MQLGGRAVLLAVVLAVAIEALAERIGLASRLAGLASALFGGERRRLELGQAARLGGADLKAERATPYSST